MPKITLAAAAMRLPGEVESSDGDPKLLQLIRTYTKPRRTILTIFVHTDT